MIAFLPPPTATRSWWRSPFPGARIGEHYLVAAVGTEHAAAQAF